MMWKSRLETWILMKGSKYLLSTVNKITMDMTQGQLIQAEPWLLCQNKTLRAATSTQMLIEFVKNIALGCWLWWLWWIVMKQMHL